MENEQIQEHQPVAPEPVVSFPKAQQSQDTNAFPKWIFAVVGLVIILAGGGFFLYQSSNTEEAVSPTPSPYVSGLDSLPTPTEAPTVTPSATQAPTSTPSATQKSAVSLEVQNGTGTTGDAALAKSILTKAGYSKVTTGNATNQSQTETTVIYSSDISLSMVNEIVAALSQSFKSVKSQSGSGKMTITVITGPKGSALQTSTPKASATPKSSATPTIKPTATP